MRWPWLSLLLLVSMPVVAGQAAMQVDASLVRALPIDSVIVSYPEEDVPAFAGGCGNDHFTFNNSDGWFRFREGKTQNGCGEARFAVDPPPGASQMEVRFWADRQAAQSSSLDVPVHMVQEFSVYGLEGQLFGAAYFDPQERPKSLAMPFSYAVAIGQGSLELGWYFEDRGVESPEDVANPVTGQSFSSTVSNVEVEFLRIPLSTESFVDDAEEVTEDQRLRRTIVRVLVPENLLVQGDVSLHMHVPDSFDVSQVFVPDGGKMDVAELQIEQSQGIRDMVVPASAIDRNGAGAYTIHFTQAVPLQSSLGMIPVVLFLIVSPALAGLIAFRGARQFRNKAAGPYRRTATSLWVSLWTVVAYYAALLMLVFAGGRMAMMTSWPLSLEGGILWFLFPLAALAFLGIGLLWRRRLGEVMQYQLEAEAKARRDLERSNQELEQFAYVASHDLQEPLRMVSSYMGLLQRRYGDQFSGEAGEFIHYATDGANRMQVMIRDLLAFSRVDRLGEPMQEVDANRLMEDVELNLQEAIKDAGGRVKVGRLPKLVADPAQLAMLLQNLVANGIKFAGDVQPRVRVRHAQEGDLHHFMVEDNGIGIDEDQRERIFQIFQRLHSRHEYEGTGIGLALCKKIVERHGGSIWVESEPGNGSTFHFTLDATLQPDEAGSVASSAGDWMSPSPA